ncbi:hypothetical protein NQP46_00400 [Streptomyces albus]|nr:hypothetical protein NQP46_00400 [Streptomyces albus]
MFDTLKEILVSKLKVSPDMITQEATPRRPNWTPSPSSSSRCSWRRTTPSRSATTS